MKKIIVFTVGIILGFLIAFSVHAAHAADTGWLQSSSIVDQLSDCANGNTWGTTSNAATSNNTYATVGVGVLKPASRCLFATQFNASIPSGATINGIEARREAKATTGGGTVQDARIKLIVAGTASGNNRATGTTYTTTDVVETVGSATDLWGLTLSDTDVTASNFGIELGVAGSALTGNRTVSIDDLEIKIYYTLNPFIKTLFKEFMWLQTAEAQHCTFVTLNTNQDHSTTTVVCGVPTSTTAINDNPSQNYTFGLLLFFISFGFTFFMFKQFIKGRG